LILVVDVVDVRDMAFLRPGLIYKNSMPAAARKSFDGARHDFFPSKIRER